MTAISLPIDEDKVLVVDINNNVSPSRLSVDQPAWFVLTASFNSRRESPRSAIIPCEKHGFFAYLASSGVGNLSRTVIVKIWIFDEHIDR
jgi:hypothetical protein